MSEENTMPAEKPAAKKGPKPAPKPAYSRRTLRKLGRDKRKARIQKEPEFAKATFERKAKASETRKVGWRKRHAKQTS